MERHSSGGVNFCCETFQPLRSPRFRVPSYAVPGVHRGSVFLNYLNRPSRQKAKSELCLTPRLNRYTDRQLRLASHSCAYAIQLRSIAYPPCAKISFFESQSFHPQRFFRAKSRKITLRMEPLPIEYPSPTASIAPATTFNRLSQSPRLDRVSPRACACGTCDKVLTVCNS